MDMNIGQIEQWAEGLLTVALVAKEGEEANVHRCLHHLFVAVKLFDQMSEEEQKVCQNVIELTKRMFFSKFTLKERKRQRKEKKNLPHTPSDKEKEKIKEKAEKIQTKENENFASDFEQRREAFRERVMAYHGLYDANMLDDFISWATEPNKAGTKMRFESQKYFNITSRLERWKNNHITADNESAGIRLEATKKRQARQMPSVAEQQVAAAEREAYNARQEQEIAKRKAGAVSYEEFQRMKAEGKY